MPFLAETNLTYFIMKKSFFSCCRLVCGIGRVGANPQCENLGSVLVQRSLHPKIHALGVRLLVCLAGQIPKDGAQLCFRGGIYGHFPVFIRRGYRLRALLAQDGQCGRCRAALSSFRLFLWQTRRWTIQLCARRGAAVDRRRGANRIYRRAGRRLPAPAPAAIRCRFQSRIRLFGRSGQYLFVDFRFKEPQLGTPFAVAGRRPRVLIFAEAAPFLPAVCREIFFRPSDRRKMGKNGVSCVKSCLHISYLSP